MAGCGTPIIAFESRGNVYNCRTLVNMNPSVVGNGEDFLYPVVLARFLYWS